MILLIVMKWRNKEYKHLDILENEISTYLRFEYRINNKIEWLHVIKSGEE
jgi:hypothetical protein